MQSEDIADSFANLNITDSSQDAARKLFVGGLSWMTTEDGLRHYFESLGLHVDTVVIMRDKTSGRSRGFGFLTLASPEEIDKAVIINLHLDGRKVEAKRAIPKSDMDNHAKKIFVGGIPISLTNADFRKYFENFGKVLETQIMTDRDSGRSRGFGFVTFEEEIIATKVLKITHTIQGKPVEVKQAEPKNVQQPPVQVAVNPIYVPSPFSYPSMFGTPLPLDQAAYLVQTQGGVVYVPQLYEPLAVQSDLTGRSYGINDESAIRRRNTAPVMDRSVKPGSATWSSAPVRRVIYPTSTSDVNTLEPAFLRNYPDTDLIPTSARLPEPRIDRAFSAPYSNDMLSESRVIPPVNRRSVVENQSSNTKPSVVVPYSKRRTDLNWRKPSVTETCAPSTSLHKYFQ